MKAFDRDFRDPSLSTRGRSLPDSGSLDEPLDLEFSPERPAIEQLHRRRALAYYRAEMLEQVEDAKREELWRIS